MSAISTMMFSPTRPLRRTMAAFTLLASVAIAACSGADSTGPNRPSDPAAENFASALGVNLENMTERADRLYIQDLVVGTGAEAVVGKVLRVRYTGWLRTGVQIDSNVNAGSPFEFTLGLVGPGGVIEGWNIGVAGMRVGGKRRLVFGSQYGYGAPGSGAVPPHATLVFDVELISIVN